MDYEFGWPVRELRYFRGPYDVYLVFGRDSHRRIFQYATPSPDPVCTTDEMSNRRSPPSRYKPPGPDLTAATLVRIQCTKKVLIAQHSLHLQGTKST